MRDLSELRRNGSVDFRLLVAVQVRPNRRIGVQIFAPARIPKSGAFAARNHDWLIAEPIFHLRERMPDVLVVQLCDLLHAKG